MEETLFVVGVIVLAWFASGNGEKLLAALFWFVLVCLMVGILIK